MRRKNSMNLDNGQDVDRYYLIRDFKVLIIFQAMGPACLWHAYIIFYRMGKNYFIL